MQAVEPCEAGARSVSPRPAPRRPAQHLDEGMAARTGDKWNGMSVS